jgi:uncharacterized phosphosugar-binding protein
MVMLKIFLTQISGLLNAVLEKEEQQIEEGSRLLAQTVLSDGTVYFYGFHEMEAVLSEALYGENKFPKGKRLTDECSSQLTSIDTVVVATRYQQDAEALELSRRLKEETGCKIILVAALSQAEQPTEISPIDIVIDSKTIRGLVPQEDGSRLGFPSALTALFVYYALYLTTSEFLEEYEID